MQICYKTLYVHAGSKTGITDDTFKAVHFDLCVCKTSEVLQTAILHTRER